MRRKKEEREKGSKKEEEGGWRKGTLKRNWSEGENREGKGRNERRQKEENKGGNVEERYTEGK